MKKLLLIVLIFLSFGSYAQSLTEVLYPQFIQGVGSGNAADDRKVPYACRMTVTGLTPSTTYRYYNRFTNDPLNTGNGQGNYILANQSGTFTRVTSASLAVAGRYGEFTTDAAGSYTGWFINEANIATDHYQPGTILYFRLLLNDGAGGASVVNRITATNTVSVIGFGASASQGTGLRSTAIASLSAKNFVMLYNNIGGTGRPISGTFIESDGTDNSVANGYAPFYANSVNGVENTWGTIIPNNLSNGINNISQYSLSSGGLVNACTAANGVYGSTNTSNASGGLTELVLTCTPASACNISLSETHNNVSCFGGTNGSIDLTVTGATAPITYSWSNGGSTQDLSGLAAESYTVTVTDANNCTATITVVISQPTTALEASSSAGTIACNGGTTTVTVSATGGTAPYTGTGTFTVSAGAYSYTVTDANGCTSVTTGTVTAPTALVASSLAGTIACNGGTTTVTVSATGGTAPYTGTGTFTVSAGAYSYTVTDANGCTSVTTGTVTEPAALVASSLAGTIACNGGTATVTVSATGGTAPYTGTGTFTVSTGAYSYTVTDANGCTSVTTGTVSEPAALVASSVKGTIACTGAAATTTVTVSATGGTAPYTGTGTFTVPRGAYSFTVTDALGCTSVTTGTIAAAFAATSVLTPVGCTDLSGTVTVSATGGTAPYTGTGVFSNVPIGTYSFVVTDATGCTATVTGSVTRPLTISASADPIVCGQTTTILSVTAGGGLAPFTGTGSFTVTAGTYTYTVTDGRGCTATTTITVSAPFCPSITEVLYPKYIQGSGTGNAADDRKVPFAARMTIGDLTPGSTYRYFNKFVQNPADASNGQGNYILPTAGTFTRVTSASLSQAGRYGEFTADASGNYTGWFIAEPTLAIDYQPGTQLYFRIMLNDGANGTFVSTRVTSTNPVTVLGFGSTPTTGTGVRSSVATHLTGKNFVMLYSNLGGTGRPEAGTFIENDGTDNSVANGYAPFYANNVNGTDKTWGTIIPNNLVNGINNISQYALADGAFVNACTSANGVYGSTATASATGGLTELVISCSPPVLCNISLSETHNNVSCFGGTNGSIDLTVTGATAPITYSWSNGGSTEDLSGLAAGSYTVTVTDANNCTATTTVVVTEPAALVASSVAGTIACNGGTTTVTVSATGGTAPYTGTGTFTVSAGVYSYTVTDANGCTSVTTGTVTEPTALVASSVKGTIACTGAAATTTVTVSATGGTAPYTGTGTFTVPRGAYSFTVTDALGCTSVTTGTIAAAFAATSVLTPVGCTDLSGTVTVSATGGTAPYTGTGVFSNVPIGTYSFVVTDATGCTATVTGSVTRPLTISASADPIVCGQTTTIVSVTAGGGLAPFTGTGSFTVTAGTYTYTVTDGRGCTATTTITVSAPFCPSITEVLYPKYIQGSGTGNAADDRKVPFAARMTIGDLTPGSTYRYFNKFVQNPADASNGQGNYILPAAGTFTRVTSASLSQAGRYGEFTADASGNYTGWFIAEPTLAVDYQPGTQLYLRIMLNDGANGTFVSTRVTSTNPVTVLGFGSTPTTGTGVRAAVSSHLTGKNFVMLYSNLGGTGRPEAGTFIENDGTDNSVANGYAPFYANNVNGTDKTWGTIIPNNLVNGINNISQYALTDGAFVNACTSANGVYGSTATANATGGLTELVISCSPPVLCNTSLSETHNNASCFGGTNGSIDLTVTGATAPITYSWSNGGSTQDLGELAAGSYTVTVTDANNCTATLTVVVTEPAALVASSVAGTIACNGGTTTVTVSATGGTAPYTGTGTFTVSAGAYSYTVTDANGCTSVTTGTVTEPTALVASSVKGTIACTGAAATTTVTVSATGGTAPYTGTGTFTVPRGAYSFTVTDALGCTSVTTGTIAAAFAVTSVVSPVGCTDLTGTVTVSATGGTAPYTGTGVFTNVPIGTYSFTVTDATGCSAVATGFVTRPLTISAFADPIACGQTTTTVVVSAGGGQGPFTGTGSFTISAGTYTYTVTDARGCTATTTITVSAPFCPTITEVLYPKYIQGSGTGNAADDRKVPFAARMTIGGLTPGSTYRYFNKFVQNPADASNGQGNYILPTAGTFTRVTSASLSQAGRYGEFTADASGNYTGWFIAEPTLAVDYQPGTQLYLRIMLNDGANGTFVSTRVTSTNPVTVLGFGSTPTTGTGVRSSVATHLTGKNFVMLYSNLGGTGRPEAGTFIENDGTDNSVANGYAPFYANNVNGTDKTWGTIIPNNLVNGINNISQYALADGAFVNACTSTDGVYGSTATANATGGLTELVISCSPAGGCDVTVGQINGPVNACAYTGLSGLLATYSVTSNDAAPGFTWTLPAGATSVTGQGTSSISFRYPAGYAGGSISVVVTSVCAAPSTRTLAITSTAPATPTTVSGPVNVCQFVGTAQQVTYSVTANPSASGYQWTVPPTVSIVSGQGTNSIVVTINNGFVSSANKVIKVRALSGCGNSGELLFYLVAQLPSTPVGISGPTSVCAFLSGSTATYSINAVAGAASYIWTAQAGTTIITHPNGLGVNDTLVNVSFGPGFTNSSITVQAINTCGTGSLRSLALTRSLPSTPGLISGPTNACPFTQPGGTAATYTVALVNGATSYNWIAPAGSIVTNPNGTGANGNVITVIYPNGFINGVITVSASNGCGTSGIRSLSISRLNPSTPGVIDAVQTASCPNRQFTYSIAALPSNAASVLWTIPVGATLVSGGGTINIVVTYPATAVTGAVTVTAISNCANSVTRSLDVKLPACPAAPFAKDNKETDTKSGIKVSVENMQVAVFPNPSTSSFALRVKTQSNEKIQVSITDVQGRQIDRMYMMSNETIHFGDKLGTGTYFVEVRQGNKQTTQKIVKF